MQELTYCLLRKKNTKNINPKVVKTKNNRLAMVSKCATCSKNKFRFIKEQEAKGLLSNLGIKTPLSKVTYSASGPFTKHAERIKKVEQTGNTSYIFKNELDKACFKHDSAYADYKDLTNRTHADKVLKDRAFEIASDPKYDGYQRGLASMVYRLFDKKSSGNGVSNVNNVKLADELHKSVIKKFTKRKVYSLFKDNIWGVYLADMQLLSRQNKGIKYLLCVIDLFSKYAFFVPLKDRKGASVVRGFEKIANESSRRPSKIWVDQGSEVYNRTFKNWLKGEGIEMYSTYNEGKSVVDERFIRTLKNKLYKHMTAIGKNVYWNVLDDFVAKYNDTVNKSIGMKPKDVKQAKKAVYVEESNEKSARFSVGDRVRISKFKNIFAKGYTPNWSKEIFVVNKIKNTVPWTYELKDLNGEDIIGSFYDRELQKTAF